MVTSPKPRTTEKVSNINKRKKKSSSAVVVEKSSWTNESSVSVITKTTNPKVMIQSEHICDTNCQCYQDSKHGFLRCAWLVVMCVIILITFFLSLKTYNIVGSMASCL